MMASVARPAPNQAPGANKRKRGPGEVNGRNIKTNNPSADHDGFVVNLLQGIEAASDDNTRTAQAALAAPMTQSAYPEPIPYEPAAGLSNVFDDAAISAPNPLLTGTQQMFDTRSNQSGQKPTVGSQEWHQQRKDNHKEVERRRREVINEGIENIAKVVPGVEKNKGAILQRTCTYIAELQQQIAGFEKERATVDVALKELTSRNDRLKESNRSAWQESTKWQQRCRDAGLQFDDYDDGLPSLDDDDVAGLA